MTLMEDLENLPDAPGVYIIRDIAGIAIYVGKAKNLKNRVRSHFNPTADKKELQIQSNAASVDYILTRDEHETVMLEKKLIKNLMPKYNIKLKDDKSGLILRITLGEKYPRLLIQRETDEKNDKDAYFGPYPTDGLLRKTSKLALKLFPICNYKKPLNKASKKQIKHHCMRYRLNRCLAPCMKEIDTKIYNEEVEKLMLFLDGKVGNLIDVLEKEMWDAAEKEQFEQASVIRDQIRTIQDLVHVHQNLRVEIEDIDVLDLAKFEDIIVVGMVQVRAKRIAKISTKILDGSELKHWKDVLNVLNKKEPKKKLLVSDNVIQAIKETKPEWVLLSFTEIHQNLLDITRRNVQATLQSYLRSAKKSLKPEETLKQMKELFDLPTIPRVINGFDISTIKGKHSTGSCVVFIDGEPSKKHYRKFRIRTQYSEPNDYEMMKELLTRRFSSVLLVEDPLPDLIIVDGGKGQLSVAEKVLKALKLDIPIVSIAKQNQGIYTNKTADPILLEEQSRVLKLVQYVRDEAHRFAIMYHRQLRVKSIRKNSSED